MSLIYNLPSVITVSMGSSDVTVDPELKFDLPATAHDAAFVFVGKDIFSGDYRSSLENAEDIISNLSVSKNDLMASTAFLVDNGQLYSSDNAKRSAYGNAAQTAGYRLKLGAKSATKIAHQDGTSDAVATNSITGTVNDHKNDLIPMIKHTQNTVSLTNEVLPRNVTSVGQSLVNIIGQSLYKILGSNVAVNNEATLVTETQNKFHTAIAANGKLGEVSHTSSNFFKRYLESGRYAKDQQTNARDGSGQVNTKVTYNMDNVEMRFKIKLTGNVSDSSNDVDLSKAANSLRIFGNSANTETQVVNGAYTTHILIAIKQDSRI